MDRRLAEHAYFAGALAIADFATLGWVWRHERHQVDLVDFPHVQRWYEAMMARPAVARGLAVPMRRDSCKLRWRAEPVTGLILSRGQS